MGTCKASRKGNKLTIEVTIDPKDERLSSTERSTIVFTTSGYKNIDNGEESRYSLTVIKPRPKDQPKTKSE